jgi:hypothetical protein
LLHVLREADPLTASGYEDDRQAALADLLPRAGFPGDQIQELQWLRIRWPQMSQEEADRRELNSDSCTATANSWRRLCFPRYANPASAGLNVCSGS